MTDQTKTAKSGGEADASLPPPLPEIPKPSDVAEVSQPATAQQLQKVEKQMSGFETATLRWARLAVAMSGVAALFVCLQWYEMHSGGTDTHDLAISAGKQADKMKDMSDAADKIRQAAEGMVGQEQRIADNAQTSLEASNRQSKAALDTSIENARLDQRAWVTVEGFKATTFGVGQQFLVPRVFKNNGRTPAVHVRVRTALLPVKPNTPEDWSVVYKAPPKTTEVLGPQEELDSTMTGTKDSPQGLSDTGFQDIKEGRTIVFDYGVLVYCDVFGHQHWTKFCNHFLPASQEWGICDEGTSNAVGDDTKAQCKAN